MGKSVLCDTFRLNRKIERCLTVSIKSPINPKPIKQRRSSNDSKKSSIVKFRAINLSNNQELQIFKHNLTVNCTGSLRRASSLKEDELDDDLLKIHQSAMDAK